MIFAMTFSDGIVICHKTKWPRWYGNFVQGTIERGSGSP